MKRTGYMLIMLMAALTLITACGSNKKYEEPAVVMPTSLELARAAFDEGTSAYTDNFLPEAVTAFNLARDYYMEAAPTATAIDSVDVMIERTQLNIALVYMDMASESVSLSMYDDALMEYESAVNIYKSLAPVTLTTEDRDGRVAILYRNMALTSQNAGQYERSLTYYDKVLEYEPGNVDILNIKYNILKENIRDEVRAYQVLKDYAEVSQDYNAFIILANAYKNNGDNITAASYFDRALEIGRNADAYTRVADFYRGIGNYAKSNEVLQRFVATSPDNASLALAYRVLAENYERLNNTAKMIEFYDKSLALEKRADVALKLANHYNGAKNWDRVINYATQVINVDATQAAAFLLRGNAYYQKKRFVEAKADLQRISGHATYGASAQDLLKRIK